MTLPENAVALMVQPPVEGILGEPPRQVPRSAGQRDLPQGECRTHISQARKPGALEASATESQ